MVYKLQSLQPSSISHFQDDSVMDPDDFEASYEAGLPRPGETISGGVVDCVERLRVVGRRPPYTVVYSVKHEHESAAPAGWRATSRPSITRDSQPWPEPDRKLAAYWKQDDA